MNFNIPDKIYKLLVLLGIVMIGYSFYTYENVEKIYFAKIDQYNDLKDSAKLESFIIDNEFNSLLEVSDNISKKYGIKNPITNNDSIVRFVRTLSGDKTEVLANDTINSYWLAYINRKFKLDLLYKKIDAFSNRLDGDKKLKEDYANNYEEIRLVGFVLFFFGIFLWMLDSKEDSTKNIVTKQHERLYSYCQSCGKSFTAVRNYGVNKDSSLNYSFCEECYKDGEFTNQNLSKEDFMKESLKLIEHRNWFVKKALKSRFKELERWNRNKF